MRKTKELRIKITGALLVAVITATAVSPVGGIFSLQKTYAAEFTVTQSRAVLYSNDNTKVYKKPDINSGVVTVIAKDLPVDVTGITSNGWFQISLNGTYYVPGDGLISQNTGGFGVVVGSDIMALTRGTFSFFDNSELGDFDPDDIADMDANTYIKYLDSFLMGYALQDFCILQDKGRYLKDAYESEAKLDKNVAAITMQAYLINYRNRYLSNSISGPFRNEKELKLALNRAIRYHINKFETVFKSTGIGSDESKAKKTLENVINEIKAEQGVSFTYHMQYGTYKEKDGKEGKGWIIEFTKKD